MPATKVFVTDFDGTVTKHDFYNLVAEELLTPQALQPWSDYRAGRITHFEAMRRIYAAIRAPEERVMQVLRDMQPDPELARYAAELERAGWKVVVASAGSRWYIDIILKNAGVSSFEINASPGVYHEGGPLELFPPLDSPFYCPENGIDKAGIVRHWQAKGAIVAYAGDSFTDLEAALLVPGALRFGTAALRERLIEMDECVIGFSRWGDVASALLEMRGA